MMRSRQNITMLAASAVMLLAVVVVDLYVLRPDAAGSDLDQRLQTAVDANYLAPIGQ